jgi:hypothetical protein
MDQIKVVATEKRISNFKLIRSRSMIYFKQKQFKKLFLKALKFFSLSFKDKRLINYIKSIETQPDYNEKYVFFPLHLQPESTTTPNAEVFSNLELVVHLVANALPKDVKLYIKEHPAYFQKIEKYDFMKDYRSIEFYNSMKSYENVEIINHNVSSNDLINNCHCVVTVNGTAGWEALFKDKPVLTFGNTFYNHIKGVHRAKNLEETERAFQIIFSDECHPVTRWDIATFLKTMEEIVVPAGNDFLLLKSINATNLSQVENDLILSKGIINFYKKIFR